MISPEPTPAGPYSVRLGAIIESGYLIERAGVRAGLILYRARPSSRAQAGAVPFEARGATEEEAVGAFYAAWARRPGARD